MFQLCVFARTEECTAKIILWFTVMMGENKILTTFIQVKLLLSNIEIILMKDLCILLAKDKSKAHQVLLMANIHNKM